jgi:hypothetical protein
VVGRWDWLGDEILVLQPDGTGKNALFIDRILMWTFTGVSSDGLRT